MAEELQLRIHTELCKATIESAKVCGETFESQRRNEVKDKTEISIINKIGNIIDEQLTSMAEEEKS